MRWEKCTPCGCSATCSRTPCLLPRLFGPRRPRPERSGCRCQTTTPCARWRKKQHSKSVTRWISFATSVMHLWWTGHGWSMVPRDWVPSSNPTPPMPRWLWPRHWPSWRSSAPWCLSTSRKAVLQRRYAASCWLAWCRLALSNGAACAWPACWHSYRRDHSRGSILKPTGSAC